MKNDDIVKELSEMVDKYGKPQMCRAMARIMKIYGFKIKP